MRRWQQNLAAIMVGLALAAAFVYLLSGCAAEANTLKGTGIVAAGSAGGSLFGPVGAAIGGGVAYLFGAASAASEGVQHMSFGARLGDIVERLIWEILAGYVLVLFLVPKSRDNLLAALSSRMPVWDRLKSLVAGLIPSPHSPPAAQARKVKREAKAYTPRSAVEQHGSSSGS